MPNLHIDESDGRVSFTIESPDNTWRDFVVFSRDRGYTISRDGRSITVSAGELVSNQRSLDNFALQYEVCFTESAEYFFDKFRSSQYDDEEDRELKEEEILQRLEEKNFVREPMKYQLANIKKMIRRNYGATFSVPGAGKTTEALAYYCLRRKSNEPLLVVCPTNVFQSWKEEAHHCFCCEDDCSDDTKAPKVEVLVRVGDGYPALEGDAQIILVNYEKFGKSDFLTDALVRFANGFEDGIFCFLDESHRIKNSMGVRTIALLEMSIRIKSQKLIMTGTPCPQSYNDLISQSLFLQPGRILSEEEASSRLTPIFVRTTKDDLKIPLANEFVTQLEASDSQKELLRMIRSAKYRRHLGLTYTESSSIAKMKKAIMWMIQVALDPKLVLASAVEEIDSKPLQDIYQKVYAEQPPKIKYAIQEALKNKERGEKTLIWSTFVRTVEGLSDLLNEHGCNATYINGSVPAGRSIDDPDGREYRIEKFKKDDDCFVLVANPASCSEGISLHKVCHHALYLDRSYNATYYLQSKDRIHRLGLDTSVETRIEILETIGSIDEKISKALCRKIIAMSEFLNDKSIAPLNDLVRDNLAENVEYLAGESQWMDRELGPLELSAEDQEELMDCIGDILE